MTGTERIGQAVMERLKKFGCTVLADDTFHMIVRGQLNMMKKIIFLNRF